MKREDIKIGLKVVPHSKTTINYGGLNWSTNWNRAKEINQPYLFVSGIQTDRIILSNENRKNDVGDYFLPEDFEPYIEEKLNKQNNNESGNTKMKKSELNSSMLFKMRDGDLCVLLSDIKGNNIFCNQNDLKQGYSDYFITLDDFDEELSSEGDGYDIVAIKQRNSCVRVIADVLEGEEPKEWDWVEEVEKNVDVEVDKSDNESKNEKNVVNNITINITIDSDGDPVNFLKQLNDALRKNGLH